MTAILALLGSLAGNPTILAILGGVVAVIAAFMKGRMSGASRERDRKAAIERDAYAKHLQDIADAANARPSGKLSDDPYNRDR